MAEPEITYPLPSEAAIGPDERKRLSQIIEEINAKYDKKFITNVAMNTVLQIKDILMRDNRLKTSAKINTLQDFYFTYDDSVNKALVDGFAQNEDFYLLLLNNAELKKQVSHVFIEDVYNTLRGDLR